MEVNANHLLLQVMRNIDELYLRLDMRREHPGSVFRLTHEDGEAFGFSVDEVISMLEDLQKVSIGGRKQTLLYERNKGHVFYSLGSLQL